jgi:hypothetical protein
VVLASRAEQRKRWDFPTIVERYLADASPVFQAVPHLAALPAIPPLTSDRCRMLDLAPLANTDPFTAPFGVPKPASSFSPASR